jgi:lipopolysaccharide biosynthesis glycosyltransferase
MLSHQCAPTQSPQRTGAPIHIAFGVNARFVPAMAVTIISIAANNPHAQIVFHVLTDYLPPDDIGKLGTLAEQQNVTIRVHDINQQKPSMLADPKEFSYAAYNRLLISNLLRGVAPKVLYLDSDIVCLGDISGLNSLDMGDAVVAAVLHTHPLSPQHMATIGMPQAAPYFNSGVLYIDLARWDEHDITRKTIDILTQTRRRFPFADQDALNPLLFGKVTFIDRKWNTLWEELDSNHHIPAETVFLHYAGPKPWQKWSPSFGDPSFVKYLSRSPWPAGRLCRPVTRKHKKRYARHLLETGDVLGASLWYLKYLATRKATDKS